MKPKSMRLSLVSGVAILVLVSASHVFASSGRGVEVIAHEPQTVPQQFVNYPQVLTAPNIDKVVFKDYGNGWNGIAVTGVRNSEEDSSEPAFNSFEQSEFGAFYPGTNCSNYGCFVLSHSIFIIHNRLGTGINETQVHWAHKLIVRDQQHVELR